MALAYQDGAFIDKETIRIDLRDHGFCRGLAFFETMRVYGGRPFHLAEHWKRLEQGARDLGIGLPVELSAMQGIVSRLCASNRFVHSSVKFYLTAGKAKLSPYSLGADHGFTPSLIVVEEEMKPERETAPYGVALYERGLRVKIMPHERVLPHVKSISYLQAYYASRQAGPGWDDILFTHREGYVTEASRANFFCVIDGVLCTPGESVLDGVTRNLVLTLARECEVATDLRRVFPDQLAGATEAFLTGSTIELLPIRQIDARQFSTTMEGPVFSKIRKAYSAEIARLAGPG